MSHPKTFIVIPAKNEAPRIGGVLEHLRRLGYEHIVVVDDGSTDETGQVARKHGCHVLRHLINLGAGAATQTGVEYALQKGAEIIVTIDADHQHLPSDIENLVSTLEEKKVDIVLGSRFFGNNHSIPLIRRIYNKIGNIVTFFFAGLWVSDSQSGMKAFRADFARKAPITRNGYEFCIEIIKHIRLRNASWYEIPINVVYTPDTLRKGQNFFSGLRMVIRLLKMV